LVDRQASLQRILLDRREDDVASPPGGLVHARDDADDRKSSWPEVARRGMLDQPLEDGHSEVGRAHEDDTNGCSFRCQNYLLLSRPLLDWHQYSILSARGDTPPQPLPREGRDAVRK